jgi:hypothetical protein
MQSGMQPELRVDDKFHLLIIFIPVMQEHGKAGLFKPWFCRDEHVGDITVIRASLTISGGGEWES